MSSPINILIITYYWPPSGGPAVQRWLTFTNLLAEKGIKLHVLTVEEESANYPAIDRSLEKQVSKDIKVYKTKTAELYWIYKKYIGKGKAPSAGFANEGKPGLMQNIARFVRGNFLLPDARKSWNPYAIEKTKEIIKDENISLVITAGPPHSTHLIGLKLKKIFNLPWIADFHDAWTDVWYYYKLMHTPVAAGIDKKMERTVLEQADRVLTVGRLLREVLGAKSPLIGEQKIDVISMGYDEKLFKMPATPPANEFVITYTGTIDGHYEPGVFFRALKTVKDKFPGIKYKLRFAGILAVEVKKQLIESGLESILEETGYVSHATSVEYLLTSTALLLVSPKVKSENIIIPGKIYEYLASRKPIINIGSLQTESAMIVSECWAGRNFDRNMEEDLAMWLEELSVKWMINPDLDLQEVNENYKKYARSEEAESLYKIILDTIDSGKKASQ